MEVVAGLILGWSVLYLVTSAYLLRRFLADGRQRLYLDLAATSLLLSVYSVLGVKFHLAADAAEGGMLGRVQVTLLPFVIAHLFDFALRFAGWEGRRARRAAYVTFGVATVLAILVAAGLAFDPSRPETVAVHMFGVTGAYHHHAATALGTGIILLLLLAEIAAAGIVGWAAVRDRSNALPVFLGTTSFVLAGANDALVSLGLLPGLFLIEHGYAFLLFGFVFTLLERSTRLGKDLRTRSRELEEANRELAALHRSLRQSYDSLSRTREELQEAERLADLGRMAASLAHEIRNPLCGLADVAAGLRGHAAAGDAFEEEKVLIVALSEEVARLDRLVDDLLEFARPDRRSRARVSLPMVADHAILAVVSTQPDAQKYRVEREYEEPAAKAMIVVDRVRRALVNLLLNACQAMPDGGTLTVIIRTAARGDGALVGVRDDGPGVPAAALERIFTPFFSTKPSGPGLGLAIVRSIAEEHGGWSGERPGQSAPFC